MRLCPFSAPKRVDYVGMFGLQAVKAAKKILIVAVGFAVPRMSFSIIFLFMGKPEDYTNGQKQLYPHGVELGNVVTNPSNNKRPVPEVTPK